MKRIHLLLGAQSALLALASLSRLWSATDRPLLPHGSLRLVELLNLLVIPPAGVLLFYVLLEHLLRDRERRFAFRLAFLASAYLFALSYGMHEPANYLHERFCDPAATDLCRIVAYQDDGLSHLLFFAGFAGIDVVLLLAGAPTIAAGRDVALLLGNALLVAAAIVANLGFEKIGLDLFVVAFVAALSLGLLRAWGRRPLVVYFAAAYTAGLLATAAVRLG